MKIAVTGASGHIGANLCRHLVEEGHEVRALVHRSSRGIKELPMQFVSGDVMSLPSLSPLVEGTEIVFHLAAVIAIHRRKASAVLEQNVKGTQNVLQAARMARVKRFVHFSSIHALVHEPFDEVLDESRGLAFADKILYSRSKALAEAAVQEAVKDGLDAVTLNPTAVIGPHDLAPSYLGRALILMSCGKLPVLVQGGYNWVDVRDVVRASHAAARKGRKGERYLLAGCWMSLHDLARLISQITKRNPPKLTCPSELARLGVPFLNLFCRLAKSHPLYTYDSLKILQSGHKHISIQKAREELGFIPRPIEETLRDTLDWFRDNGYLG